MERKGIWKGKEKYKVKGGGEGGKQLKQTSEKTNKSQRWRNVKV